MMLKGHLSEMRRAERAIARATEIYAQQGHEDLFQKASRLLRHAQIARETFQLVVEAEEQ